MLEVAVEIGVAPQAIAELDGDEWATLLDVLEQKTKERKRG